MRIAVFGTGGVGGYFGGRLTQSGKDVTFIARGEHLRSLQSNGLRVDSILGDFTVSPVKAVENPNDVGEVDVVILGVKAWQVGDAAKSVRPMVGSGTCVLPLQNGVEAPDILADEFGPRHVLGGLCGVISFVAGPGHIKHVAENEPFVTLGELDNQSSERTNELRAALRKAGVKSEVAPNIQVAMWQKLILIASMSSIGAVTRTPIGVWRSVPDTRSMYNDAVREIYSVALASGINVPEEHQTTVINWPDRLEPNATTSLQRDIADGYSSELEEQIGVIVRKGRETGTPTPIFSFVYSSLQPCERVARGNS